ncbi:MULTISPECIES: hypothetical protein [unclassified Pseudomonas]|uniref:type IV pilus modification PilV family protein n=1 Tax=unclassified Pseudomonas TaxID=196821 RepID=UPI0023D85A71|nr:MULTISPECIES: hypothetical protein [unclassified Pseudomonas]MED5606653.1 hypothetical protein [Pseudomonas sp. JH-2]
MDAPVFPSPSTEARGQQGYVLLDALIGVVLMSILCLGLALGMAMTLANQRNGNLQALAVAQMRDLLQRNGQEGVDLCAREGAVIQLPGSARPIPLTVSGCAATTVQVAGTTLGKISPPLLLKVSLDGGEISVGGGA